MKYLSLVIVVMKCQRGISLSLFGDSCSVFDNQ